MSEVLRFNIANGVVVKAQRRAQADSVGGGGHLELEDGAEMVLDGFLLRCVPGRLLAELRAFRVRSWGDRFSASSV